LTVFLRLLVSLGLGRSEKKSTDRWRQWSKPRAELKSREFSFEIKSEEF
jgi:hypothetical protein